jgi:hypothetical protein
MTNVSESMFAATTTLALAFARASWRIATGARGGGSDAELAWANAKAKQVTPTRTEVSFGNLIGTTFGLR